MVVCNRRGLGPSWHAAMVFCNSTFSSSSCCFLCLLCAQLRATEESPFEGHGNGGFRLYKRNIKRYVYVYIYVCKNHMHVCHTNCCWLPPIQKMLFLGGEWPQTSQKCLKPSTTTATAANWCSCNLCIMLLKLSQRKWSHFQEKVDKALEERLVLYQFLFATPSRLKNLQTHDVMWILIWSCLQVP